MSKEISLVLEDGSAYRGYSFGAPISAVGEVVFNTSMIGYQEILTDPSYAGQIVVPTYPLIGNYGVNKDDFESAKIQVKGFVVREECVSPSHFLSQDTIHDYLADSNIPGIWGLDTRAITRKLRSAGVMMGIISDLPVEDALYELRRSENYGQIDFVRQVSTGAPFVWQPVPAEPKYNIVALDCGLKYSILRILASRGCRVTVVPCTTPADEIVSMKPDGVLLSPGPGDPALLGYVVETAKKLAGRFPIMGICLGNQIVAQAFGGKTFKLKFGHRGGNHPVKDLSDGKVYITAQNHGYAVDPDSLGSELEVTHINLNDGTVEGVRHKSLPIFCIQYHSEASPGPLDSTYLFDRFIKLVKENKVG